MSLTGQRRVGVGRLHTDSMNIQEKVVWVAGLYTDSVNVQGWRIVWVEWLKTDCTYEPAGVDESAARRAPHPPYEPTGMKDSVGRMPLHRQFELAGTEVRVRDNSTQIQTV